MKKFLSCIASAVYLLSFFSCSNDLSDSKNLLLLQSSGSNSEYGTIVVGKSDYDSRKLGTSDVANATVTVSGYGMDEVTGTVNPDSGKLTGKVTVEKVPTGKNRVISISSGKATIRELIPEVKSGTNSIDDVTWDTTVLGSIYYYLIKAGINVSGIDSSAFSSAIPTDVHACFVNVQQIALDYVSDSLKSASSYKIEAGTVKATVYGYSGKSIQIGDPASEAQTAGADGSTLTFSNVLPGSWNVYADGEKVKTIKVDAGNNDVTIGNAYSGHMVVYVSASSAPRLWIWQVSGSYTDGKDVLGCDWNSRPTMAAADGMSNNNGWYMYDLTANGCHYTEGIAFKIKLNDDANVETGKTATFWYDAAGTCGTAGELYDSDPTENQLSNNANLASISVNGTAVSGFASGTTSYTSSISAGTTSASVTAVAEDSAATVSVSPSGSASIASGSSQVFVITVTAEDGTTKTYTVTVKRAAENDTTLASITVNGKAASISGTTATLSASGSDDSFTINSIVATAVDSNATVTPSATTGTVADGASKSFTITVTNGTKTATYTLTVSYTKVENISYYQTNAVGFGKEKTISIDGDISDWSSDMLIAQGVANDDPRVYRPNSMYEMPIDLYAMYGAFDDNNLYLMVEFTNVQDIVAPSDDYPISQGYLYQTQNLPFFIAIDTGKGNRSTGAYIDDKGVEGASVWGSGLTWEQGFTSFVATSTNLSNGPWYYPVDESGRVNGINGLAKAQNGIKGASTLGILSSKVIGLNGAYGETSSSCPRYIYDTFDSTTGVWVDFNELNHNTSKMDFSYEFSIPLTVLGITKNDIKSSGVGVSFVATFGTSGMDCLPYSRSMQDNADQAATLSQTNNSKEKEDDDVITEAFARIGK